MNEDEDYDLEKGLARMLAEIEARDRKLAAFIESHGHIGFMAQTPKHREGTFCVLTRSTKPGKEGKWQASFFDALGAWGDMTGEYVSVLKDLVNMYSVTLDPLEMTLESEAYNDRERIA